MDTVAAAPTSNNAPSTAKVPGQAATPHRQPMLQSQKRKALVQPAVPGTQHAMTRQNSSRTACEPLDDHGLLDGNPSDPEQQVLHTRAVAVAGVHQQMPDDTAAQSGSKKRRKKLLQQCVLPFPAANGDPFTAPDKPPIPAKSRTKKPNKQPEHEEQLPEGRVHFCNSILEITTASALAQCQQAVKASAVCCLALLMKEGQHYFSTLRPLSKSQTTSMHKQVAKAKSGHSPEDVPAAAAGKPPKGNAELSHTAGQQEVLGLAIFPMTPPQTPPSSHPTRADTLNADSLPKPPADSTNTSSQMQHNSRIAELQSGSSINNSVIGDRRLWLLPSTALQENEAADSAHEDGSGPPAEQCRALLKHVLTGSSPTVCFNMQETLSRLLKQGCQLPGPGEMNVADPKLMAWLQEPQLLQRDEKEIQEYTLQVLASRYHLQTVAAAAAPLQPLEQLRSDMLLALQLAAALEQCISPYLPAAAVQTEMQVAAMLANMESVGLGFNAEYLLHHEGRLRTRIRTIEQEATRLVGSNINLASAAQLSVALYDTLALPAPRNRSDRGSAKTHHTTDEAALKQLAPLHPLPALVLEYRCMQNILNKWVEPDWVKQTAAAHTGGHHMRVRCSWNQTATATGRLSSSSPNLQAVTKYTLGTKADVLVSRDLRQEEINIRDAFVASPSCVLISADYSQVELRVLAHLSGDPQLVHILTQAGLQGDAFALIAKTWLRQSKHSDTAVTCEEREKAKKVTYGIVYGLSAWGLAKGPAGLGIEVSQAQALICSFLNHFRGVKRFVQETKEAARARGFITTLGGRRRPIKALPGRGLSAQQARAEADRKAVNSTIQGSAADLIKLAMCAWSSWQHAQLQPGEQQPGTQLNAGVCRAVRLVAQIHDELLFEANTKLCDIYKAAGAVQQLMEGVAACAVPLTVNVSCGQQWGTLHRM